MSTLQATPLAANPPTPQIATVADLLDQLGGVPPERVRMHPAPGTATEQDVLDVDAHGNRLCELVDGVLVEKTMGIEESLLAAELTHLFKQFVNPRKLGLVTGPDGTIRLLPGQVRLPDVAFFSWDSLPGRRVPTVPIPAIAPDLAVEVLSRGNTSREMDRKLVEYFDAGARLVWYIDPRPRTAAVYTSIAAPVIVAATGILDGAPVLPGFTVRLPELFAVLDQQGPPSV